MGEFGFVTADDVYHVTVYATDKEGRFKILSMKNIHLKSCKFILFIEALQMVFYLALCFKQELHSALNDGVTLPRS